MGIHRGPNTVNDDLVFGYDTGYGIADNDTGTRFYPGESTANLADTDAKRSFGVHGGNSSTTSSAPEYGLGWKKLTVTNIAGSNNRVVQFPYITQPNGGTRTYSVEYDFKNLTGYSFKVDGSAGYSVVSVSGKGRHSVTIGPISANQSLALFLIKSGTHTNINEVIYYRDYQVEEKTHATPFTATSRSSTTSLIDLKRTASIDVSNVTFGSTGQPTFDGTDDRILSDTSVDLSSYTSVTYEGVLQAAGIATHDRWFSGTRAGDTGHHEPDLAIAANGQLRYIFNSSGFSSWHAPSGLIIDTTKFNHLVYTFTNAGVIKIYINGVQEYTATHNSGTFPSNSKFMIGTRFDNNGEAVTGSIPIAKVYSKALTADEVKQNYNAYKNRFDL